MLAAPPHWHSHSNAGLFTVVALHLCALWLLARPGVITQTVPPTVLSVSLLAEAAPSRPEPERMPPSPQPPQKRSPPAPQAAPLSFSAEAPAAAASVPEPTPAPVAATVTAPVPIAAQAAPSAPRFDADYLQNPAPAYPALSRRLGEEGMVVLRVYVEPTGRPGQVEVKTGSASARLDHAAQNAVWHWKFIPARRGGEAVGAWVLVPIVFNLRG